MHQRHQERAVNREFIASLRTAEEVHAFRDEKELFDEEYFDNYAFQAPDRNYAHDSDRGQGWGFPTHCKPPVDLYNMAISAYKRYCEADRRDVVTPEFRFWVLATLTAHIWWMRRAEGAAWLMGYLGCEENPPFYDAYAYLLVDPSQKILDLRRMEHADLGPDPDVDLRIYRRCERRLAPPIGDPPKVRPGEKPQNDPGYDMFCDMLKERRHPNANKLGPPSLPPPRVASWLSKVVCQWLDLPLKSSSELSGKQWVLQARTAGNAPFYPAIHQMQVHAPQTHRVEKIQPDGTGVINWYDRKRVVAVPLYEMLVAEGVPPHEAESPYICQSCERIRPCVNDSGHCASCYGTYYENGERPSLTKCLHNECEVCPAHLDGELALARKLREIAGGVSPSWAQSA